MSDFLGADSGHSLSLGCLWNQVLHLDKAQRWLHKFEFPRQVWQDSFSNDNPTRRRVAPDLSFLRTAFAPKIVWAPPAHELCPLHPAKQGDILARSFIFAVLCCSPTLKISNLHITNKNYVAYSQRKTRKQTNTNAVQT